MTLNMNGIIPSFGGHEKFVFRHSWLKKGVDLVTESPSIFAESDALIKFGVGKNMVRSIRYWCQITELIQERELVDRKRMFEPTSLAINLLDNNGWDPYLEDIGTLWLLHWKISTNIKRGLIWYLTFSSFLESEFSKQQLVIFITKKLETLGINISVSSIEREVDCFFRTYIPARSKKGKIPEDSLDCPLSELELLRFYPEFDVYHFNVGPKPSLPNEIFAFSLLEFLPNLTSHRRTVAVEECIYNNGSPGQIYKLDEKSVEDYLIWLEDKTNGRIRIQETAGLQQLYIDGDLLNKINKISFDYLCLYYEK
jgi:hypothetical protein